MPTDEPTVRGGARCCLFEHRGMLRPASRSPAFQERERADTRHELPGAARLRHAEPDVGTLHEWVGVEARAGSGELRRGARETAAADSPIHTARGLRPLPHVAALVERAVRARGAPVAA